MPSGAILPPLTKDAPFPYADYERWRLPEGGRGLEKGERLDYGIRGEVPALAACFAGGLQGYAEF